VVFAAIVANAPVAGLPLVPHAERPRLSGDVIAARRKRREIAALADRASALVDLGASVSTEIGLARLRLNKGGGGQRRNQKDILHLKLSRPYGLSAHAGHARLSIGRAASWESSKAR
jgi:hypothetical protein